MIKRRGCEAWKEEETEKEGLRWRVKKRRDEGGGKEETEEERLSGMVV